MAQQTPAQTRFIRRREVQGRTGLSKTFIYEMLDRESPSYDPAFPKQVRIGARAVGWVEAEIAAWIEARIAQSRQAPSNASQRRRSVG